MQTLLETSEAIRTGRLSAIDVTEECLARIARLDSKVHAFITVTVERAREQARRVDQEIRAGQWRGPLHGIPIGLKDLIDTAEILTTAGSRMFADRIPSENASVWELLEAAGAVLLGKQNLHEFAYGGSSMVSAHGEVHNPWNLEVVSGGSSGGSAAAVALGMGFGAIGTDTAGSIREPASLCGVVGLKPSYGRVNADGVVPLSRSLDHVGPITRTVADAAAMFDVISEPLDGKPPKKGTSISEIMHSLQRSPRSLRIGIPREHFFSELDSEVDRAVERAISEIAKLAASVDNVKLSVDKDSTLQAAEMYEFHSSWVEKSPELYQAETLRRLRAIANVSAERRATAQAALHRVRNEIGRSFTDFDLLVTPTTPMPAPLMSTIEAHPDQLRPIEIQLLRNTRPFNAWGLPAISLPCGFTKSGLPIGLQIAGAPGREDQVLQLAYAYEQATEWHLRVPALATE